MLSTVNLIAYRYGLDVFLHTRTRWNNMFSTVKLLTYRCGLDVVLHTYTLKCASESEVKV